MTIALCDPRAMIGKTVMEVADIFDADGSRYAILFSDGSIYAMKVMTKQRGENTFCYNGRDRYDATPQQVMKIIGGMAVDLKIVTKEDFEGYKAAEKEKHRQQVEESERQLFIKLKEKFEPEGKLAERLNAAAVMLEEIVCTVGDDAGVVMLSTDGPCHPEPDPNNPGHTIQVYNHDYFSPLGDALIALHKKLKED